MALAQAEAERRLTSAKAGAATAPAGLKRGRTIESEDEDEEISGDEGGEEMKVVLGCSFVDVKCKIESVCLLMYPARHRTPQWNSH